MYMSWIVTEMVGLFKDYYCIEPIFLLNLFKLNKISNKGKRWRSMKE